MQKHTSDAYNDINSNDLTRLTLIQADIMAYQLNQTDEAVSLLTKTVEQVGGKQDKAELKLKLADIYLHEDEVWEATLLYSQVDKSMKEEPLGHEARFKNAQLRYFIGEYEWAESQLKVLKAATSKLIANDAMTLSLVIKDNLEVDSTGVELNRLARIDYRTYQQQIVEQYPESYMADAALMHAALIEQSHLKNKELAKQHYEKLIDEYPTSIYTAQAKKNYRKL